MNCTSKLAVVVLALVTLQLAALTVEGATVGYYRFENSPGFLVDSSPNSHNLTNTGVTQYTLPGAGAGSNFPNPVPLTGTANLHGATFNANTDVLDTGNTGSDILSGNAFTAEAFINYTGIGAGARGSFLNQWDTGASERSWMFSVENTGELSLWISPTGSATAISIHSNFDPTVGVDYYAAVAFETDGVTGGTATFYLKNLATGVLQSETINHAVTVMNYDDRLAIGAIIGNNNSFLGTIDEARLSNMALSLNELLISQPIVVVPPVPEPSTLGLFCCGLAFVARKSRRVRAGRHL